ncbi:MAG: hypothetical protein OES57_15585 [Acidimicrobiia bacterium]|nr:hypothetical protein [Acidimicrobiia bacterium]
MTDDLGVMTASHDSHLRPVERTVLRLQRAGLSENEIAWRLRRSPGYVRRTSALAQRPQPAAPRTERVAWDLRPIERRVLRSRERGVDPVETAARLRRTPEWVQNVGRFADYKLEQVGQR